MGRISVKGGVWRNTEDEILKAAVMKYGKNQWSRIASLLHRKSAKQCKSRWVEWLDPNIKKTEWSRDEDEKLLHLAKLMPTQWRTIAPIVGRTASQCLERYEQLLDKAQNRENDDEDPRKLRAGEVDPQPETKPAKPDAVDMDEDELEMLAEARARLANTQGKKAKRKAREKQIEEARRLAKLQKIRELKEAGIGSRRRPFNRRKQRLMFDYNREIPFEKKPAPGYFDTEGEDEKLDKDFSLARLRQQQLELPSRHKQEMKDRREDAESLKKKKEEDLPAVLRNQQGIFQQPAKKRTKLVLPAPQISDQELEEVVKLGTASMTARQQAEEAGPEGAASTRLLPEYSLTPNVNALRTPRVPYGEATPASLSTSAGLATPGGNAVTRGLEYQLTPSSQLLTTPGRFGAGDGFEDVVEERMQQEEQKKSLEAALMRLPEPKDDYEIVVPENETDNVGVQDMDIDQEDLPQDWVEDQAELDAKRVRQQRAHFEQQMRLRCKAYQLKFPRPSEINSAILKPAGSRDSALNPMQKAEDLIKQEMLSMLYYDMLHPLHDESSRKTASSIMVARQFLEKKPLDETVTESELAEARKLIADEQKVVEAAMGHGQLGIDAFTKVWEECYSQVLYVPAQGRYNRASIASKKDRVDSADKQLEQNRSHMTKEAKKAAKMEKKLKVLLGGYQGRAQGLLKRFSDTWEQLEQSEIERHAFVKLQQHEQAAIESRLATLRFDVQRQEQREKQLQQRFQLMTEKASSLVDVDEPSAD